MAERRKLSLGNVTDRAEGRTEGRTAGDAARSWKISPRRAEELKLQARDMRRNPTPAQQALWERLKDKQCGFTFNREVVMGSAIVDFACRTRWLVVETGGEGEAEGTIAALSDRKLTDVGVRVLRFSDDEVLADIDRVVKTIKDALQQPFERPRVEAGR